MCRKRTKPGAVFDGLTRREASFPHLYALWRRAGAEDDTDVRRCDEENHRSLQGSPAPSSHHSGGHTAGPHSAVAPVGPHSPRIRPGCGRMDHHPVRGMDHLHEHPRDDRQHSARPHWRRSARHRRTRLHRLRTAILGVVGSGAHGGLRRRQSNRTRRTRRAAISPHSSKRRRNRRTWSHCPALQTAARRN